MVDLQGNMKRRYQVQFSLSRRSKRKIMASTWPASAEENLTRLADAGFPQDRGLSKCTNCGGT